MAMVSAIQMTSTDDVKTNLKKADALLKIAKEHQAKLVVLPEMFALMGTDTTKKFKVTETFGTGPIQDFLADAALKYGFWIVGGTIALATPQLNKIKAASLIYNDQGINIARYDKIHLFDVSVVPGKEEYKESHTTLPGQEILVIDSPIGKLGVAVCYDIRFPELFREMFNRGAEVFAIPAAFTQITGLAHWEVITRARAIENLAYVVSACQGGEHPGARKTFGHSMIINPWGEILATLADSPGVISQDIDLSYLKNVRMGIKAKQ